MTDALTDEAVMLEVAREAAARCTPTILSGDTRAEADLMKMSLDAIGLYAALSAAPTPPAKGGE